MNTTVFWLLILAETAHLGVTGYLAYKLFRFIKLSVDIHRIQGEFQHTTREAIGDLAARTHRLADLTRHLVH